MTGRLLAAGLGLIVLLGGAYATWTLRNERAVYDARVEMMRGELIHIRAAIRKFREERGRYPHTLEELTPEYLRRVPADPLTGAANWKLDTGKTAAPSSSPDSTAAADTQSGITDIHSAAGPPYSAY